MFDVTLGEWYTTPVYLEVDPGSKPFNARYYQVHKTNKETFFKDLLCIVDTGVLTPVQKPQYGMPIFIIPKKEGTLRFIMDYQKINQKTVRSTYLLPIV